MKKLFAAFAALTLMGAATQSQAFFWDDDDDWYKCPPWAYDCNPYDEWDPRYWMEEMEQVFDDDDDYYRYGGYGPMPTVLLRAWATVLVLCLTVLLRATVLLAWVRLLTVRLRVMARVRCLLRLRCLLLLSKQFTDIVCTKGPLARAFFIGCRYHPAGNR